MASRLPECRGCGRGVWSPASCPCVLPEGRWSVASVVSVACSSCGAVGSAVCPQGWAAVRVVCPECGHAGWLRGVACLARVSCS